MLTQESHVREANSTEQLLGLLPLAAALVYFVAWLWGVVEAVSAPMRYLRRTPPSSCRVVVRGKRARLEERLLLLTPQRTTPKWCGTKMRRLKDSLPIHVFVRRQQVLDMYRKMHRGAGQLVDKELGRDIRAQIRHEFKHNATLTDNMALRNLMQDAQRNLIKLQAMTLGSTASSQTKSVGSTWLHGREANGDDSDDERGRVGKGWPWK